MDLTYAEVGATRDRAGSPPGYRWVQQRGLVGRGEQAFTTGATALRTWEMFTAAGLRVSASAPEAAVDVRVNNGIGLGPLRIWAPCRIVWLVDEPGRYGFGMGTLAGHPERGEEAFELALESDGRVWFEVRAFSQPATWYTRAGGPVGRLAQDVVTARYIRALRSLIGAAAS